jgi:hypothetical protein
VKMPSVSIPALIEDQLFIEDLMLTKKLCLRQLLCFLERTASPLHDDVRVASTRVSPWTICIERFSYGLQWTHMEVDLWYLVLSQVF